MAGPGTIDRRPGARAFDVYVDGERFFVEVDPRGGDPVFVEPGAGGRDTLLSAPMPGLVLRHLVREGQAVKEGEQVLVMEAMKMENSLPSPIAGTIRSLPVGAGTKVEKGVTLAIITPH